MDAKTSSGSADAIEQTLEERFYRWAPTEWMVEPGANCLPLQPLGSGIVKTLPPSSTCVFDQELPPLPEEVRAVNGTFLEVSSGLAGNKWMAVLPAFFFAALSIIGTIYGISAIFIGSNLVRFWELGVMGLVALLFSYVASYDMIGIAFLSPEDEPIRFHRRDKKIYCYRARHWRFFGLKLYSMGKPTVHVVDWVHCRAEVSRRLITTGKTARRDCFLELAILDPKSHTVAERFPVGDRDVFSDFSSRILLWETIRRYMEEGTERVPPAVPKVHRGTFIDCIEEFNPFSMPAKSAAGAQRAFGYFFGAILLTIGLLLLPMALSRWLSMKASRKIDWGELEESTFKIASDDPARHHASQPDEIDRRAWEGELKRRRKAAMMWLTVSALQLAAVWWYFFDPNYYE